MLINTAIITTEQLSIISKGESIIINQNKDQIINDVLNEHQLMKELTSKGDKLRTKLLNIAH